jgi:hypothetical protein
VTSAAGISAAIVKEPPHWNRVRLSEAARADASTVALIETWGRLHAVRTLLGLAAVAAYPWALNQ